MNLSFLSSDWMISALVCAPVIGAAVFGLTPVRADLSQMPAAILMEQSTPRPIRAITPQPDAPAPAHRGPKRHAQLHPSAH